MARVVSNISLIVKTRQIVVDLSFDPLIMRDPAEAGGKKKLSGM